MKSTSVHWWWFFGIQAWVFLFFLQKTNLAASDLGRHIKNGEVIVNSGKVFSQNLYSYTNPDFYAPNHHWLFGVISYLVHSISGFAGLTILCALLYTAAVAVGWWYAAHRSNAVIASIATLFAVPLFAHRSETRPEAFSLFFFAVLWWLIGNWLEKKSTAIRWWHYVLPIFIIAAWVNIHIFFILAVPIIGAAAAQLLLKKDKAKGAQLIGFSLGMLLATLANPFGLTLVVYPFQIFSNYGYRVAENQPLWFFLQHFTQPIHWYVVFFVTASSLALVYVWSKHRRYSLYLSLLFIFFAAFTARLIRMENVLALISMPILAEAGMFFWTQWHSKIKKYFQHPLALMSVSVGSFALLALLLGTGLFLPFNIGFGVGLYPRYDQSINFVRQLHLNTAIFNNFDAGSFLIYSLYPAQKVFIDNRAEAYPADFLQNQYIKAQQDETVWQQLEKKYQFGAIIFYRQENTNWGQEFLVKRIEDPSWVPIYVDNYLIIFLKDSPENKTVIEQYRLPAEMFTVTNSY